MSSEIEQKIRIQAMLLILANFLPAEISLLFASLQPIDSPIIKLLFVIFFAVAPFYPLVIWLINRKSHPLISECTREFLNFTLSNYLYATIMTSILIGGCFGAFQAPSSWLFTGMLAFSSFVLGLLGLFYVFAIMFGSIQAARGNIYRYPLTIHFFN